jgi:hypothetical protein
MSSRWQEEDHSNEDAATTFHCPSTEESPALVADHYDSASGLTLTASRPAQSARSRRGLAAAGEDIKLTRPGKSHPIVKLPRVATGPPVSQHGTAGSRFRP